MLYLLVAIKVRDDMKMLYAFSKMARRAKAFAKNLGRKPAGAKSILDVKMAEYLAAVELDKKGAGFTPADRHFV